MIQNFSIPTHPPQNLRQIRLLLLGRQCAGTSTVHLLLRILLLGLLLRRPRTIPAGLLLLLRVTLVERRVHVSAWRHSTRRSRLLVCLLLLLLIMIASVSG